MLVLKVTIGTIGTKIAFPFEEAHTWAAAKNRMSNAAGAQRSLLVLLFVWLGLGSLY